MNTLLAIYQILAVVSILYIFKDSILKLIYKNNYLKACFLDVGICKYFIVKDNIIKFDNLKYAVNRNKIYDGIIYYITEQSEPLTLEWNENKCEYYIHSREFTTVIDNSVLKRLLISRESDIIKIILILNVIVIGIMLYMYMQIHDVTNFIEYVNRLIEHNKDVIKV
jgi:hypothetical protein